MLEAKEKEDEERRQKKRDRRVSPPDPLPCSCEQHLHNKSPSSSWASFNTLGRRSYFDATTEALACAEKSLKDFWGQTRSLEQEMISTSQSYFA